MFCFAHLTDTLGTEKNTLFFINCIKNSIHNSSSERNSWTVRNYCTGSCARSFSDRKRCGTLVSTVAVADNILYELRTTPIPWDQNHVKRAFVCSCISVPAAPTSVNSVVVVEPALTGQQHTTKQNQITRGVNPNSNYHPADSIY